MKLVTGSLIAQLLPFFVLPLLTRTMGAEEFGIFSLFFTTTIMLGTISALRFEYAINAASNHSDAKHILFLCIILNILAFGILIIILSALVYFSILTLVWLLLPLSVISMSLNQSYYLYANYMGEFGKMSRSKITNAGICAIIQFSFVYIGSLSVGAYIGIIVGYALSTCYLFYLLPLSFARFNYKKLVVISRRYIKYPKLVFPGTFINFLSGNLPIYLISFIFGAAQAGYYSLAIRVAGVPTMMLGRSIGEVFRNVASRDLKEKGNFRSILIKVSISCFVIAVAGFCVLYLFAQPIFEFVFGQGWGETALFVQILIPMFIMQFTTAPIAYSLMLVGWQKEELYWQVFRLIIVMLSVFVAYIFTQDIIYFVFAASFSLTFSFIVYFYLCFQSSQRKSWAINEN